MKIKTKDANLYNCEGFMTDIELVDKINNTFKNDTELGMTLAGLIEISPRDFFCLFKVEKFCLLRQKWIKLLSILMLLVLL